MIFRQARPCQPPNLLVQQAIRAGRKISRSAAYGLSLSRIERHYSRLGLQRGKLSLTFDCDYAEDSAAADEVRGLLDQHAIRTSWAVIGEWVKKFPDVYKRISASGHELLNHTLSHPNNEVLRPHDPRKFAGVSFRERRGEIIGCHEVVRDLLGYEMQGFRAPHFSMAKDVYTVLADNGYVYSSSRLYNVGPFLGGAHVTREGVVELPLLGPPVAPFSVPATYFLYRAPQRLYRDERDFYEQFRALLKITSEKKLVTVIYFDPCDVVRFREPKFEAYLRTALDSGLELCRMDEIAHWLRQHCSHTASRREV